MIRVQGHFVICNQVTSDGFAIVRPEQFCWSVPQLSGLVWFLLVQSILKLHVAFVHKSVELSFVSYFVEVEGFAWFKDRGVLGKISVIRIV